MAGPLLALFWGLVLMLGGLVGLAVILGAGRL